MKRLIIFIILVFALITISGCSDIIENPEDFTGEKYKNFSDVNNITNSISINPDEIRKVFESENCLIFAYQDSEINSEVELSESHQNYMSSLIDQDFVVNETYEILSEKEVVFNGTVLENDSSIMTVIVVFNQKKFKKSKASIENIRKIDDENIIIKMESK